MAEGVLTYPALADPISAMADHVAMMIYGRARADKRAPTKFEVDGFRLSSGSLALLFASPSWLMTLWDKNL